MPTSSRLDPHESRDCARFRSAQGRRCAAYGWCKDEDAKGMSVCVVLRVDGPGIGRFGLRMRARARGSARECLDVVVELAVLGGLDSSTPAADTEVLERETSRSLGTWVLEEAEKPRTPGVWTRARTKVPGSTAASLRSAPTPTPRPTERTVETMLAGLSTRRHRAALEHWEARFQRARLSPALCRGARALGLVTSSRPCRPCRPCRRPCRLRPFRVARRRSPRS